MTPTARLCCSRMALALTTLALALNACTSAPEKPAGTSAAKPSAPAVARPTSAPPPGGTPGLQTLAPLASALSGFDKDGVRYLAVLHKATFTYEERPAGATVLTLLTADLDPLALDTDVKAGLCTKDGSPLNEQTVDYPYAAVLTRAATLTSVSMGNGKPMTLRAMGDSGLANQSIYTGLGKRSVELAYDRCVGSRKADSPGHRLDTYLPNGARIVLRPAAGKGSLNLAFDGRFAPFVVLKHANGRLSAAPSRIVLVDIDAQTRRVHVHYRTLLRAQASMQDIELRAVIPESMGGAASAGETPQAWRKRSAALLDHLARCERRTGYSEPCADAARAVAPDLLR